MKSIILFLGILISEPAIADTQCITRLEGWRSVGEMSRVDLINLEIARKQCVIRKPNKPCVVVFRKKGFNDYHAICGFLVVLLDEPKAHEDPYVITKNSGDH